MAASLSGMTLPSWASHLRHRLAPPPLLLVQAFVNTRDLDLHTDVLAQAGEARAWLADGLVTASGVTRLDQAGRARELSRMLGGLEESEFGQAHAEELLAMAAREREAAHG